MGETTTGRLAAAVLLVLAGAAAFGYELEPAPAPNAKGPAVPADIDGDGVDELVQVRAAGTVYVLDDGAWTQHGTVAAGAYTRLAAGDVNGDGVDDVTLSGDLKSPRILYGAALDVSVLTAPVLSPSSTPVDWSWSDTGAPFYLVRSDVVSGFGTSWGAVLARDAAGCDGLGCDWHAPPGPTFPYDGGTRNLRVYAMDRAGERHGASNVVVW